MLFVPVTTLTTWYEACEQLPGTIVRGGPALLLTHEFAAGGFGAATVLPPLVPSQMPTPASTITMSTIDKTKIVRDRVLAGAAWP